MISTVNEVFERVISYMPENLVSPDVVSLFKQLNEKFPEKLTDNVLFECPLGTGDPVSDLSFSVSEPGREIIAGKVKGVEIAESLFTSQIWNRIRSFCEKRFLSEMYYDIGSMFLEFDLESLRKDILTPGVFLNTHISAERDLSCQKMNRYTWIIEGLECLRGRPLEKEIKDNLVYCLDALPDKESLDYAALMLSRPQNSVRIVVRMPADALKDYLSLIKYPGDGQELYDLVTELSQFTNLRYNLDISDQVLSRIGIECSLIDRKKAHREKWMKFLNHLVERSACIPEKRDALMEWLGYIYVALPQDSEPYYIFRRISHIKVVYEKGKPLLAKAYPDYFRILEMDLIFNNLVESSNTV
ncbi:MAG: hypothetical protein AB9903_14810 [Vulcanimicrobiota bacterium]